MVTAFIEDWLASEAARNNGEFLVLYTSPHIDETPDDRLLFRRYEAIRFFQSAFPVGEI